jgi:hypothetical protein
MRDPWLQSLLVAPPTIAGVRMRPLSLWHVYALRRLGVSISAPGLNGLVTMLAVCRRGFLRGTALLQSPGRLQRECSRLSRRLAPRFVEAIADVAVYAGDYVEAPEHVEKVGEDDKRHIARAPWEWHVLRVLCRVYGLTLAAAWDTPVGYARCLYSVEQEAQGDDSLVSENMMVEDDYVDRIKAATAAGDTARAAELERELTAFVRGKGRA